MPKHNQYTDSFVAVMKTWLSGGQGHKYCDLGPRRQREGVYHPSQLKVEGPQLDIKKSRPIVAIVIVKSRDKAKKVSPDSGNRKDWDGSGTKLTSNQGEH